MSTTKRLAVLGAGAIGGALGGQLAKGGLDVTLIDQWPEHVEQMRARGLRVIIGERETPELEYTVPVKAMHLFELATVREPFDYVFLACKSYDTAWHTQLIRDYLAPTGTLVSLQNSLNNEWIEPILGAGRSIGGVMLGGGELLEPGVVWRNRPLWHRYYRIGELEGAPTPRVDEVAAILGTAGVTETTDNFWGVQWSKLVLNCTSAALSALVDPRKRSWELVTDPLYRAWSLALFREGVAVGTALGYRQAPLFGMTADELTRTPDEVLGRLFEENADGHSKGAINMVQQDLLKGRRTEVPDYFNGLVARKADGTGVATPANEAVAALYVQLERGEISQTWDNLRRIEEHVGSSPAALTAV
jgi:2-dehydropantoate 2-reductase